MTTGPQQQPEPGSNPYLQPEYHTPNPYQQATAAGPAVAGTGGSGGGKGGGLSHTAKMSLAIAASVVMVAGTTVGGFVLTSGSDDDSSSVAAPPGDGDIDEDGDETDPDGDADTETDGEDDGEDEDEKPSDPRGGLNEPVEPVVDDDWQVQAFPERNNAFDVPPEWTLSKLDVIRGYEFYDEDDEHQLIALRGAATYMEGFCGSSSSRALVGTTGARGASSTEQAASNEALNWAHFAYDETQSGTRTDTPPEPFTNDQGFEGHIAISEIEDFPIDEEDEDCASPSGKVIAISYLDAASDVVVWLMVVDTGIEDELEQETIDQITNSLRWHDPGS
ncbi:hypothetical protein [Streptomyces otsuchiensis]|uniref:hypothetical protein n=1 Tax=Streptomyces otsuchiensis TaxID=2681388 RepID=UPI001300256E|nr:hypothetical protein [Streptomyces otsuchiensis]